MGTLFAKTVLKKNVEKFCRQVWIFWRRVWAKCLNLTCKTFGKII